MPACALYYVMYPHSPELSMTFVPVPRVSRVTFVCVVVPSCCCRVPAVCQASYGIGERLQQVMGPARSHCATLLLAKGLWGHVEGTEVLEEGASERTQAEYRQKAQKAFSTIVMAITTSQLYLVTSCEDPKEAWDTLRNHFERKTLANKLFLKKQYFRMEMKERQSRST